MGKSVSQGRNREIQNVYGFLVNFGFHNWQTVNEIQSQQNFFDV